MSFKIFVSYSSQDIDNVNQISQLIEESNIEVFVSESSLEIGTELKPALKNAINNCDLFILLWTENAKNSEWVSQEIGIALAKNKTILPLVTSKELSLPGFIKDINHIAIYKDSNKGFSKLRNRVLELYKEKEDQIKSRQVKQKNQQEIALIALGVFLLWLFNQK